ncbi:MAG: CBS domain-containing protein [Acidimicrobiia bacterium]
MSFVYPDERYYYDWYSQMEPRGGRYEPPTDGQIKSRIVDRLRVNPLTEDCKLRVDVKRGVVILGGVVSSRLAKRAAGDDCWDTDGVVDVSNHLEVAQPGDSVIDDDGDPITREQTVLDVMTPHPVVVDPETPAAVAAEVMRDHDIGALVVAKDGRLKGMVTDRDLVVRLMAEGRDSFATTVGAICSSDTATAAPSEPASDAATRMRQLALRRLPVVDVDQVIGVVSLGDLARRRDPGSVLADISAAPPSR